jgi:hypothetical protein
MADDDDDEDLRSDPATAFDALRAEVAALKVSLEGAGDRLAAPDYAPTLGKIAASLARIEAHPVLQLTPEAFASQVRQASEAAQQQGRRELANAVQRVDAASADLEHLAERQRPGRRRHRVGVLLGADRARPAGELGRARKDGGGDVAAGPLGCWLATYGERAPAGLGKDFGSV